MTASAVCRVLSAVLMAGIAGCSDEGEPGRGAGGTGRGGSAGSNGGTTGQGGTSGQGGATGQGGTTGPGGATGQGGSSGGAGGGGPGAGGAGGTGAGGTGGASGSAGTPAACPASDEGNVSHGPDVFVPNTGKQEVSSLTYTNVGASGAYAEVVTGWSRETGCVGDSDGNLCRTVYRQPKQVSGPLAPFNEDMSMVYAGPIELYQIAVYAPAQGEWQRTAYWDRCVTEGLVFAGNKHWYECAGFVESYVTPDGTRESDVPVQFSGKLAAGTEVNVMSDTFCSDSTAQSGCGWSSGLHLRGFKGDATGSKIFATKLRMPIADTTPAYWILPAQVIRSSQYGCNCRGAGSDPVYRGGCGEIDIAEVLGGVTTSLEATTTLYSFQDITGGGSVAFNRPVNEAAVFLVIFDAQSRQIGIRRLRATEFSFAGSLSNQDVTALLANSGTLRALD
jgi:hypothetical protein